MALDLLSFWANSFNVKIGAFVSTTIQLIAENITSLINEFIVFTEEMTIDEMIESVRDF